MKLYILASLIILGLVIRRASKKQKKEKETENRAFWEREHLANTVRRKSLDGLNYIKIPLESLPVEVMPEDTTVQECLHTLYSLANQSIVNLTGYSNTDLKLEYGTANLSLLSEYDQNYTLLVQTLQQWADVLYQGGYPTEARTVLEFSVSTHTDISRSYYLLAEIYASELEFSKIEQLCENAQSLRSANRKAIVRTLQEAYL